jgi:hypothetical protein
MRAHDTMSSKAVNTKSHIWLVKWVVIVTLRSSMNPRIGGQYTSELVLGPLVSPSVAVVTKLIPITNRSGEIVHPVTISFPDFANMK